MPALNFPDSPAENATYTNSETGVVYVYKNGAWRTASNETNLDDVYVQVSGDDMTGDLTLGTDRITLDATDGSVEFGGGNIKLEANGFAEFDRRGSGSDWGLVHFNVSQNACQIYNNANALSIILGYNGAATFTNSVTTPGVVFGTPTGDVISKTLNDYEEGTWTPKYEALSTDFTSVTYVRNSGRYVKIGDFVWASFYIYTSSVAGGSGNVAITQFPFTLGQGISMPLWQAKWGANYPVATRTTSGTDQAQLYKTNNTTPIQAADFSTANNRNQVEGWVIYKVQT